MRHDRIYKSMTLHDFMACCSFTFAHGGVYLGPLISNYNYLCTTEPFKKCNDEEKKVKFMKEAMKITNGLPDISINVTDMGDYYDIWTVAKE